MLKRRRINGVTLYRCIRAPKRKAFDESEKRRNKISVENINSGFVNGSEAH